MRTKIHTIALYLIDMNYDFTCAYCESTFVASRSDAIYCTDLCRTNASKIRLDIKQQLDNNKIERQKTLHKIKTLNQELKEAERVYSINEKAEKSCQKKIDDYKALLLLSEIKLYPYYIKYCLKNYYKDSFDYNAEKEDLLSYSPNERSVELSYFKTILRNAVDKLKKKLETLILDTAFGYFPIMRLNKKLKDLNSELSTIDTFVPSPLTLPKPKKGHKTYGERKRKRRPIGFNKLNQKDLKNKSELGGQDIQNMKFDTYVLRGELGQFLGELDKNKVAFALTGDSGAGKSYFSFELARLFLDAGMRVKYYALEEGIGKLVQEKLIYYDIGNELIVEEKATLADIRKDAKTFNVIMIDSYSKIATKPEEFENLRESFPKTLFVIIFQKTTNKTIRGGSSIKYNSSATIDVSIQDGERIATIEKGRYGTQGWIYSITNQMVIKRN